MKVKTKYVFISFIYYYYYYYYFISLSFTVCNMYLAYISKIFWPPKKIFFFFLPYGKGKGEREVVCGQVWWPILGICPLHLTHPSAHSQQWTHTWSSGQPCCGARGAGGGSVPCSRVSPQSWYWRWREHLLFTPPTDNPCRTWESNRQPLGYKSNSLTIRPRLPLNMATINKQPIC